MIGIKKCEKIECCVLQYRVKGIKSKAVVLFAGMLFFADPKKLKNQSSFAKIVFWIRQMMFSEGLNRQQGSLRVRDGEKYGVEDKIMQRM